MAAYKTYTVSRKVLVVFAALYLLNFLMSGKLAGLFMLVPSVVIDNYEFWRLFTFSLAPGPIEGLLLFGFTMFAIAPRLEEFLNNSLVIALLIPLAFLQGVVFTILFWRGNIPLAGPEGLAFFLLSIFAFLNPKMSIRLWFLPRLRIIVMTLLVILTWTIIKLYDAYPSGEEMLIYSTFPAIFGILCGAAAFLQMWIMRKYLLKHDDRVDNINDLKIPEPEELKMAMIASSRQLMQNRIIEEEPLFKINEDPEINQQLLDKILDKMNDTGKDSLTPNEIRFLEDYSNYI